ncbi:hypothetical protein BVRB_8g189540 [Beta vulgaris subsp. vulgaris]|nr:hypothetical protein BVRB_8g189540 [Beta vulgaris subsp. vulgaris]
MLLQGFQFFSGTILCCKQLKLNLLMYYTGMEISRVQTLSDAFRFVLGVPWTTCFNQFL